MLPYQQQCYSRLYLSYGNKVRLTRTGKQGLEHNVINIAEFRVYGYENTGMPGKLTSTVVTSCKAHFNSLQRYNFAMSSHFHSISDGTVIFTLKH